MTLEDRLAATLLGCALGDALGLPLENLAARTIARRFGEADRFHLLGRTGFVSDDTEQSALVAQALIRQGPDPERCADDFGRALVGWFLRLPFGIGLATIRACLKRAIGLRRSGVMSAGNGAAMRAAVAGVALRADPAARRAVGRALAEVTHRDPRGVEGALHVAELAAELASAPDRSASSAPTTLPDRLALATRALCVVADPQLLTALRRAHELAPAGDDAAAASALGTSGFVVHTVPFAVYVTLVHGHDPLLAIRRAVLAGGDTDSIGAIVGALCGALHGTAALPAPLIDQLHDGPFGPSHLRALAAALARRVEHGRAEAPDYSAVAALARNLALFPVVLAHGLRRLVPWP